MPAALFKDELLVRTAHGMEPTPRAQELQDSVRQILLQTERLMHSEALFEPGRSERTVSLELSHGRSIRSESLLPDRMVCAMREGHPLSTGRLTLKRFLAARHLRVAMSPTDLRFVESKLAARGLGRRIAINVPQWLLVPEMLRETDFLGVVSERFGRKLASQGIVCKRLPLESPEFEWRIYSHHRHAHSRAHAWMKQLVTDVAAGLA